MSSLLAGAEEKASWGSVLPPGLPYSSYSQAYENARIVFAGQGRLYGFTVYSSKASAQFILVFDSATLPGSGAIPVICLTAAATSNLGAYYGSSGRWFTRGCWLANSSTATSLTAGSADTWFDAQYVPSFGPSA